ncbi:MAG: hypothetical protein QM783_02870 [Phycisphaerales bacterium]
MWAKVRTILVVTLVTFLIWVWADAETQKDDLLRPSDTQVADEAQLTIETLPVLVALPASDRANWQQVKPDVTVFKNVKIAGPRAAIERLKQGDEDLRAAAIVVLDDRDLQANLVSKSVELAPAWAGIRFVGAPPVVRITVTR